MWRIPTWSNAVDGIASAFSAVTVGEKKLSYTHSLQGKRDRTDELLGRVIRLLSGDSKKLTMLLKVYLDVIHIGLRELHTLKLYPSVSNNICHQAFYEVWVLPFLISLSKRADLEGPHSVLLRNVVALLQEHYVVSHEHDVDSFLNKRVIALFPRGFLTDIKMQIYKNRNRRVFSFNDENQNKLFSDIINELGEGECTEKLLQELSLLFRSGAILRSMDKWLGGGKRTIFIDRQQQERTAQKLSLCAEILVITPHLFLEHFNQEVDIFCQLIGRVECESEQQVGDINEMSEEEISRHWPVLLIKTIDDKFLHCTEGFFLEAVHNFCVEFAPLNLQQYLNSEEISKITFERDFCCYGNVIEKEVVRLHEQAQKIAFLSLKKMVIALHSERQLGLNGVTLASTLIAIVLTNTYRITNNELTQLLNVMVENLPTNNELFPQQTFTTPFNRSEYGSPGMPLKKGQDISKDDEALIFALACRLHNEHIYSLYKEIDELHFLAYPFTKIDAALEQLFSYCSNIKDITSQTIEVVFRKHGIRRFLHDNGNPCWRLSDATPYFILRNIDLLIQITGLKQDDFVCLHNGMFQYCNMSNADKRRLLKIIDPVEYRKDIKKWWAEKKALSRGQQIFEVEGNNFLIERF
ncbi:hypothetical protein [Aeromonas media]|uniref:hypothetical protein n=1 Tax=Aeromonas media TaxID=651 RepID=UPI00223FC50E|nr:hypothetical protein [Aeromonas media]